ncbi:MAG: hypothetical protein IT562_13955 [Alphaproteobacteria bacterium]|nr:hypothetical protein [Alphaproteobacteria bacterium]
MFLGIIAMGSGEPNLLDALFLPLSSFASPLEFRAALATHRLIVGAVGFCAVIAVQIGWRRLAASLAVCAALYGTLIALVYAGPSRMAVVATAVTAAGLATFLAVQVRHDRWQRVTIAALVAAGCIAATSFLNFHDWRFAGQRLGPGEGFGPIHYNDQFHYYLGAKYARELSYDGLYACAAQAEAATERAILERPARDLRTNSIVTMGDLVRASPCRERFSSERWKAFENDARFFRSVDDARARLRYMTDFGYNATPLITLVHGALVAGTEASTRMLGALALIDVALFAFCIVALGTTFGPLAGALAAFAWGVGLIWVYDHVGLPGSIGRLWWVSAVVAGICLVQRKAPLGAGAAFGCAVMLRVLPGAFLVGPGLLAIWELVRVRRLNPFLLRLLAGAVLAGVLASAATLAVLGVEPHLAFIANTAKHASSRLSNFVGLSVLTTYSRGPLWAVLAAALVGLAVAVGLRTHGAARVILLGLIALFGLTSTTNYDYVVLVLLAPMALMRAGDAAVPDVAAFGGAILAGNLAFIAAPGNDGLVYWVDSIIVLFLVVWFSARLMLAPRPASAR